MLIKCHHIKAVGRNIMGSTAKGDQKEERHRQLHVEWCGKREGDARQGRGHHHFHHDDPPALGLKDFDDGAPQRFDDPRQRKPRGIERTSFVAQSEALIHQQSHDVDDEIGDTFHKIEGRHPLPRLRTIIHTSFQSLLACNSGAKCRDKHSLRPPSLRHRLGTNRLRAPSRRPQGGTS